ncbi:MAG: PGF-CTERM sorting domain-containing protein, partial [Candidatus Methanospirareceae archaeon]
VLAVAGLLAVMYLLRKKRF